LGILTPIYIVLLPSLPKQPQIALHTKLQRVDWLGILLSTAALTTITIGVTSGGSLYAWSSARTIIPLAISAISTTAFFVTQYKLTWTTPSERLFPASPLCNHQLFLLSVTTASTSAALLISIYYIPVHFLYVFGDDANIGALRVIPFVSFWWWLLVVCDAVLPKTGFHGAWYVFSGLCLTAGGATMYTVRAETTPQTIAGFMVLYILGLLTSEAQYSVGAEIIKVVRDRTQQKETVHEENESAITETEEMARLFGFAQALGGLIGLVVATAVFQNTAFSRLDKTFRDQGVSKDQVRPAITGVRSEMWKSRPDVELRALWLDSLVKSVDGVWIMVAVAGALCTVSAYCMSRKRFIAASSVLV
jgi:LPXTG-motif cell wall-anchored protein